MERSLGDELGRICSGLTGYTTGLPLTLPETPKNVPNDDGHRLLRP